MGIIIINSISITIEGMMACTSVGYVPQHGCEGKRTTSCDWFCPLTFTWAPEIGVKAIGHMESVYTCWPLSLGFSLIWKSYSYICICILLFKLNLFAYVSVHTWRRTHLKVREESWKANPLNQPVALRDWVPVVRLSHKCPDLGTILLVF